MTKENNGWISVDDRLPELNEDGESNSVLLYGKQTHDDWMMGTFIGYIMDYEKFYPNEGHCECYEVTHWAPLPPPPITND